MIIEKLERWILLVLVVFVLGLVIGVVNSYENKLQEKDVNTNTLLLAQKDSFDYVVKVSEQVFLNRINQDSLLISDLKKKGVKPKNVNDITTITIIKTDTVEVEVLKETLRNGLFPWDYKDDCISFNGVVGVNGSIITNKVAGYKINSEITIYNFDSIIKWYQFKKKKKEGYKMNLRNIFSSKIKENISGVSGCFDIKVSTIKKQNE